MKNSPCMDCVDRKLLCHGSCKRYQVYRVEVEKEQAERQKVRDAKCPLPKEILDKMAKVSRNRRNRGNC